jgi:hypothetical protein
MILSTILISVFETLATLVILYIGFGLFGLVRAYMARDEWLPDFKEQMQTVSFHITFVLIYPYARIVTWLAR